MVFSASIILEERRHGANNAVRLELLVRKLTSAKAWKMSKVISVVIYLWFVLGLVCYSSKKCTL